MRVDARERHTCLEGGNYAASAAAVAAAAAAAASLELPTWASRPTFLLPLSGGATLGAGGVELLKQGVVAHSAK